MLEGRRIGLLVTAGFEDTALTESLRAMSSAGARVVVIGDAETSYEGRRGRVRILVQARAELAKPEDFHALIVLGGCPPDGALLSHSLVELVREASQSGRVIAAICHGYRFLIPAGVVSGRRVTSYRSAAPELTRAGAVWVDEPVVADGNVITARRTADLPRLHRRLIEALTKDGTARDKQA